MSKDFFCIYFLYCSSGWNIFNVHKKVSSTRQPCSWGPGLAQERNRLLLARTNMLRPKCHIMIIFILFTIIFFLHLDTASFSWATSEEMHLDGLGCSSSTCVNSCDSIPASSGRLSWNRVENRVLQPSAEWMHRDKYVLFKENIRLNSLCAGLFFVLAAFTLWWPLCFLYP